jgi:imidazolonepropionase-like amidohydrolase
MVPPDRICDPRGRMHLRTWTVLFGLTALSCAAPPRLDTAPPAAAAADLALVGGKVYRSPRAEPVTDGVVLVLAGKIIAVGKRGQLAVPASAHVIDCAGKVIAAGFWNSHIHFTESVWQGAATAPSAGLEDHLRTMLTRWGFTTVYDLGSSPDDTLALRRRIESGELTGPAIFTAGNLFPKDGRPVYIPKEIPLQEVSTAAESAEVTSRYLAMGLDGIKLFTGSFQGVHAPVIHMDPAAVAGAVAVAHAQKKPVFTHPQDRIGVDTALASGVDVLAHTIPDEGQFTADELAQHVALIPTLALWPIVVENDPAVGERLLQAGVNELRTYFAQGGTILFGTDVGFHHEYDTTHELEYMARAMPWQDVLAALTTNPSRYFQQPNTGTVDPGSRADLVVLDGDPATDVKNLARVAYTLRGGKIIYQH